MLLGAVLFLLGARHSLTAQPSVAAAVTPAAGERLVLTSPREIVELGRSRLTGLRISDQAARVRRSIICKISNAPAEFVRPQAGLNSADIVYEHVTEGAITRFSAIFQSRTPPRIGPVRSARLIDLELPRMYDAALCFSGASIGVGERLRASSFSDRVLWTGIGGYYRTGEDKPFEHTLYVEPTVLWAWLEQRGLNRSPLVFGQPAFDSQPPPRSRPGGYARVAYRDWTTVEWYWEPVLGRYLRWADGARHRDANDGIQVMADNVIILYAVHEQDETICEYQEHGVAGGADEKCLAGSTQIQLWGRGDVTILRDGRRYNGYWLRSEADEMMTFWRPDGTPLYLQFGTSWVQVVPTHYLDAVSFDGPAPSANERRFWQEIR